MSTSSFLGLAKTMQMLTLDSPRVIAERVAMLSQPSALHAARDRAEVTRMFAEKQSAAMESYLSMWTDVTRQYQKFLFEFWASCLTGNVNRMARSADVSAKTRLSSANRALKPYQRRASANARRLSR